MARKSKYEQTIPPNLEQIKQWLSEGVPERDIAKNLKIASSTWRKWKNEKSEFSAIFGDIKVMARVTELENNMFRLANGFSETITKAMKCKEIYYDDHGRRCEREYVDTYEITVFVPPNFNANRFLLTNWSDDYANDPALMRQRKEEFEHKKKMDEDNSW